MNDRLFTGCGVAMAAPFCESGVNEHELKRQVERHISAGTRAMIACGTTGEPSAMTPAEKERMIRAAIDAAGGRIQVIAGTGCSDTSRAARDTRLAGDWGADAALVVTPYYNKCTQRGLIEHYTAIADAADIPIIVYNVPSRTGLNMLPETFARLSEHENICGMKEASGNIAQITELARLCGNRIALYSGNDDTTLPVLALGGQGVISVTANILPEQVEHMVEMYMAGDVKGSREMQFYLNEMNHALMSEVNPIPVKTAMRLMGMDMGALRLPLTEMQGERLDELKAVLRKYALI